MRGFFLLFYCLEVLREEKYPPSVLCQVCLTCYVFFLSYQSDITVNKKHLRLERCHFGTDREIGL